MRHQRTLTSKQEVIVTSWYSCDICDKKQALLFNTEITHKYKKYHLCDDCAPRLVELSYFK